MKKVTASKDHYMVINKYGDFKIYGEIAKTGKAWIVWDAETEQTIEVKTIAAAEDYFRNKINS